MRVTIDQIADAWHLHRRVFSMSRKREAMKGGDDMGSLLGKATNPEQANAKGEVIAIVVQIIEALLGKPEETRRRYARLIEMAVCEETREPVGRLARIALQVERPAA